MFSDPTKVVEQCGIQAGNEIADLGAGSGFYTIAAGKALHSTGRIYAVDVHPELLSKIKNLATREKIYNVEIILGDIEKKAGTKLRDHSVDMAFLCNVLFQVENKIAAIEEAKRILKPGGKLLVVDWTSSFGGIGPRQDHVVRKDAAMDLLGKAGFHLEKELSAGAHHYGLIYKKL